MLGAQSVARAFPEYPTTIVKVYSPALHLKDYISMAGPEIMTVGRSEGAQKTFLVITRYFLCKFAMFISRVSVMEIVIHWVTSRVTTGRGKSWNLGRPFYRPVTAWKTAKVVESHGK